MTISDVTEGMVGYRQLDAGLGIGCGRTDDDCQSDQGK